MDLDKDLDLDLDMDISATTGDESEVKEPVKQVGKKPKTQRKDDPTNTTQKLPELPLTLSEQVESLAKDLGSMTPHQRAKTIVQFLREFPNPTSEEHKTLLQYANKWGVKLSF